MTAKEYIQRSNANGKWVSETMFLDTIHRLEDKIQSLSLEIHKINLEQAHDTGHENRDDAIKKSASRYVYLVVGTLAATVANVILNLLSTQ